MRVTFGEMAILIDFDIDVEFFSIGTERFELIDLIDGYYHYGGNGNGEGGGYFLSEEVKLYNQVVRLYVGGFGLCE